MVINGLTRAMPFQELLDRKEKLAVNQIDALNKRINVNQTKVNQHRGVPGLENEVERLDQALKAVSMGHPLKSIQHVPHTIISPLS
jgi:hypothetical protein